MKLEAFHVKEAAKSFIRVGQFCKNGKGEKGEVEEAGTVCPGDVVALVNGTPIVGTCDGSELIQRTAELIKLAPRPLTIVFIRRLGSEKSKVTISPAASSPSSSKLSPPFSPPPPLPEYLHMCYP